MKKILRSVLAMCVAAVMILSTNTFSTQAAETTITVKYAQSEARTMLSTLNSFRTGSQAWAYDENNKKEYFPNLLKLKYDYDLEYIAMQRAAEIAVSFSHNRPNGTSCFTAYKGAFGNGAMGENIAWGTALSDADDVLELFKETNEKFDGQGHRRNMLSDWFSTVAFSCVYYKGCYYWVQEFSSVSVNPSATTAINSSLAVDASGNTVLSAASVLGTPKLGSASNGTKGVNVTWSKVSGASGYYVYRKTSGGSYKMIGKLTSGSTVKYLDTSVTSGTTYIYTVRAYKGSKLSGYTSSGVSVKYLRMPSLSSATNGTKGVKVSWGKVGGASGYYVYRKTASSSWSCIGTVTSGSKLSFADTKASSGTTYYYTVRAYSGKTKSGYSTAGVKTLFLKTSTPTATSGTGVNTVKWTKVTGAKGYYVYRKTTNGSYRKIGTVSSGSTLSYVDSTAEIGVAYYYTVRAYNGAYMSSFVSTANTVKAK